MKKVLFLIIVIGIVFLTGCGKNNSESVFKSLTNKISKLSGYKLSGVLDVKNSNNNYTYNVSVSYMKKDKFRVSLVNVSNNHEQVILRNDDGVFVLTPSLNKSFKFQSDWPYNNSQIYILNSIIDDLNNDNNVIKEEKDGKYVFTSKVNYPNNSSLIKQKVTVNSDKFIEKIEVLNESDNAEMIFTIDNIDYNPTFDESYFEVNSIINTSNNNLTTNDSCNDCEKEDSKSLNKNSTNNTNTESPSANKTSMTMNGLEDSKQSSNDKTVKTATLEDIIYPLYLPSGTVLKEQEKVSKTDGERVILTFTGDKGFTLVEETVTKEKEFTVIPTFGEPGFVNDTVGAITDNSLSWISNDIEYYMVSDVMNTTELLDIANSINVKSVTSLK